MRRYPPYVFAKPWVLLCEGEADKRFFDRLIRERNVGNDFYVQFPDRGERGTGGWTKFGWWLKTNHEVSETFRNVEAVLIVSDKDDDADVSFERIQKQIRSAPGFPVPAVDRGVAKAANFPTIVVLMVPMEGLGNLETLCLQAAEKKWKDLKVPLDTFVEQTPAHEWPPSKQSKMRLQTTLAATCKGCPDTSFANHWFQNAKYRIPVDDECFNPLVEFLDNFGTLIH